MTSLYGTETVQRAILKRGHLGTARGETGWRADAMVVVRVRCDGLSTQRTYPLVGVVHVATRSPSRESWTATAEQCSWTPPDKVSEAPASL